MTQATNIQPMRKYRAFVYPVTTSTWDFEGEEGSKLQQSVHLKALNSEDAREKAKWVTGMNVYAVERKD